MLTISERNELIGQIRGLPAEVASLVRDLSPQALTAHFLAGEWSVAQNVHHLVDSHMNSYIRCKLILTEENPLLKPYDQEVWASLPDAASADISYSLAMLTHLHTRWVLFWEAIPDSAWERTGFHPENGPVTLEAQLQYYAAHGHAHLDQMRRTLAAGGITSGSANLNAEA
jgi:hypothetical protein